MSKLILLRASNDNSNNTFVISGSKSISQRALIINHLVNRETTISNLSNSEDTSLLYKALLSKNKIINVGKSGTSIRFLTALFALINKNVILTGDSYLFSRPILGLIEVLNNLGANVELIGNQIIINKGNLNGGTIYIDNRHTSQFVSAMLLIAPYFEKGLKLNLYTRELSKSYIDMTLKMINYCGGDANWHDKSIVVNPQKYNRSIESIESDWSSISYIFLSFLFSDLEEIVIKNVTSNSIQGDMSLKDFFAVLGIKSIFNNSFVTLTKQNVVLPKKLNWNCERIPDLCQTFVVACLGLGIEFTATGIKSLYFKETNRVHAMKQELLKFNTKLEVLDNSITLYPQSWDKNKPIVINTYGDHRMALSFSALVLLNQSIIIDNYIVINKSYPNFWNDLIKFGVNINYMI